MPAHMMVLNPVRRARKGGKKRRRKMTAKQLEYFGPKRRRKARAAKKSKAKVVVVSTNPRRARQMAKKRRAHKRRHFRRNPIKRRHARRIFRRNPLPGGFIDKTLVPAGVGALGALGVDLLLGNVNLGPNLNTPIMGPIIRIAAALGIGWAVGSLFKDPEAGEEAAAGAITVTMYAIARNYVASNMPNVRLGRYVPMRGMGQPHRGNGMGRYVPMRGMGNGPIMRRRLARLKGLATIPPAMRPARMGAFVNPARTVPGPGAVPGGARAMARYLASQAAA